MKVTTNCVYPVWYFLGSYNSLVSYVFFFFLNLLPLLLFLLFFLLLQQACPDSLLFMNSTTLLNLTFLFFSVQRKMLFERPFMQ